MSADWTGTAVCAGCHAVQYEAWRGSHHDLAMQGVSEATVLGAFDGRQLRRRGVTATFFRRDGGYWVRTEAGGSPDCDTPAPPGELPHRQSASGGCRSEETPDEEHDEYRIAYVFGVYPLQQYLIALPGGRLQALDIAWDSRSAEAGGQRWFHLAGPSDSPRATPANAGGSVSSAAATRTRDPMHWTGAYYNWNSRCAECHSTNLSKAYDAKTDTYATTWSEINVACEACHGPGARHVALAESGRLRDAPRSGLETTFGEARAWTFVAGEKIARPTSRPDKPREVENCARCHARRTTLAAHRHGVDFLGTHSPTLLEDGLYYADGQIREEVYVYGSFAQSKMYQAGVTCRDCHDPHSLALRAPGNAVCAQCHLPSAYDTAAHHHHAAGSPGAACVNCHMPATVYMGVDPRRDHSFQIPRSDLSAVAGTPNACNRCHEDRGVAWAAATVADWGVGLADAESHRGRILQRARRGDRRAAPALRAIAMDPDAPPIWRATAAAELRRFPSRQAVDSAATLLASDDAMLRLGAVRAFGFLPWRDRLRVLEPHLGDPVMAVRMELARALADVPPAEVDAGIVAALETLFNEYLLSLAHNADMPEALTQRADFLAARRLWDPAEHAYRDALERDPQYLPALLNLADLYRRTERDEAARNILRTTIDLMPAHAAAHHALGLLETRADNRELALRHLRRAAELETDGVRYRYVHAIALHDSGDPAAAIEALKALLHVAPGDVDVLLALVNYCRGMGRLPEAQRYANELRELLPDDPAIRRLHERL